jgi:ATP phosphoribosyltransferase regulatory subunit
MIVRSTLRLPAGMRDFAPEAAAARRRIAEALLGAFERWGFSRVITPAFEYEDVLALGLGSAGRAAAIRFVEPSSGQVVALPPDITPQIARLIATRFRDEPGPLRLSYEGTVVRLDQRARSQREVIQAGVELAGVAGPPGDAEIVALGAAALAAVGLEDATIDLGHLGLAREVFEALELPEEARVLARARIAKRDRAGLRQALEHARGPRAVVEFAALLPELSGPPAVLDSALRRAPPRPSGIRRALEDLRAVVRELSRRKVPARLHVDLGEVRGFDYYTGVRVQGFADGAAEPVLQGGRYDALLGRYGRPWPAVGFAIDVEATAGALELVPPRAVPGGVGAGDGGVLVSGPVKQALALADTLRRAGRRAATDFGGLSGNGLAAYARRWRFSEVRRVGQGTARVEADAKGTSGAQTRLRAPGAPDLLGAMGPSQRVDPRKTAGRPRRRPGRGGRARK